MKNIKNLFFLSLAVLVFSCQDVDLEPNLNNPDGSLFVVTPVEGAENPDLKSSMDGAAERILGMINGFEGIHPDLMADQLTSTNRFSAFWDYNFNPRQRLINDPNLNSNISVLSNVWDDCYTTINNANNTLEAIEAFNNTVPVAGVDLTNETLATAHFVKGLALGYLGMVYDKAYYTSYDVFPNAEEFTDYNGMIEFAVGHIDTAISIASSDTSFEFSSFPGSIVDRTTFLEYANSMAARLLLSAPRTDAEAQGLDYSRILSYANSGMTSDFEPLSVQNVFFSNYQDWTCFVLSDGAGYLPVDLKVINLLDPSYPDIYPEDPNIVLGEATSSDPRLEMYYDYANAFGFLNAARDRTLFTNYKHDRYFDDNFENQTGLPVQVFMEAEIDLIKAECMWRMGDSAGAAAALNASPRSSVGGITTAAGEVEDALHYEYSVELDRAAGIWTHMAFMRRHDLLQVGTPLQFPIPATTLEILGLPFYNFGGTGFTTEDGTATGANFWRD